MRETGPGMAAAANRPATLRLRRPARQEEAAPHRVTDGSHERGGGQGAVGAAGGIRMGPAQGPDRQHPG